jgi:hypothetical protein
LECAAANPPKQKDLTPQERNRSRFLHAFDWLAYRMAPEAKLRQYHAFQDHNYR